MPAVLFPGVLKAVSAVNNEIKEALLVREQPVHAHEQAAIDLIMLEADGTEVILLRQG